MAINKHMIDKLYNRFGTHAAVANRLGITESYYRRVRGDPLSKPSKQLRNAIATLCRIIELENELARRS